ncbi:MAG: GPW/gp25 family protein, partial [Candidatus Poseidoniales archaeon]
MAVNPSAFRDAEATNDSDRSARIFKDFNFNFAKHPVTGDIAKLTDVSAVKASVKNLVFTNFYERPFHPEIGSDVRAALFENVSPLVAARLGRNIEDVIVNFEPRAELISVIVNLKTYMKNQTEFSDYNFEGSALSTLVDLLAYNTHYLGMNANMAINEAYLDTATLRSSVVSHAKTLGYTPRSARAPVAYLNVTLNNSTLTSATVSKG